MDPDSDPSPEGTDAESGLGGLDEEQESAPEPTGRRFDLPRLADLEERLGRLEDKTPDPGLDEAYPAGPADAAAVEELRRAIVELEARVDANVARLQKVEAADAARLRRFDSEVRKISGAATAGLRQALEEAQAAGADAARIGRIEAQINELAAAMSERFRPRTGAAGEELLDLNEATLEELRDLGISGTQATRVIAAREAAGGFGSLDELDALSGFPSAQLEALKAALRL